MKIIELIKKTLMVVGALFVLIMVLGAFSTSNHEPKAIESTKIIQTPIQTPTQIIQTPIQTIQPNDDKEFERVTTEAALIFATDRKGITDANQKDDNIGLERYGEKLESDAIKYLNILDTFHVSPKFKDIYDEYYARFEDSKKTGEYFKTSGKFLQLNDLSNGAKYMNLATDSLKKETAHVARITAYYTAMIP